MSGKELLEGMSYVDDKYIEEAEKQFIRHPVQRNWIRWASLAACLCIGFLGMFAVSRIEKMPSLYPEEGYEFVAENASVETNELAEENKFGGSNDELADEGTFVEGNGATGVNEIVEDMQLTPGVAELAEAEVSQSIGGAYETQAARENVSVILRVDAATENGFRGIVTEAAEGSPFVNGMELNVVLQTEVRSESQSVQSVPKQESAEWKTDGLNGNLVEVSVISYEEETATVVVKEMKSVE